MFKKIFNRKPADSGYINRYSDPDPASTEAPDAAMRKVLLYTSNGAFVVSGWIPPFDVPPEVIVWGDRHFRYSAADNEGVDVYVECFTVALVKVS